MPVKEEMEQMEKKTDDLELSDDDLDAVAGGAFIEPNIARKPNPVTFEDPILGRTGGATFENPVIATGLPTLKKP